MYGLSCTCTSHAWHTCITGKVVSLDLHTTGKFMSSQTASSLQGGDWWPQMHKQTRDEHSVNEGRHRLFLTTVPAIAVGHVLTASALAGWWAIHLRLQYCTWGLHMLQLNVPLINQTPAARWKPSENWNVPGKPSSKQLDNANNWTCGPLQISQTEIL